MSFFSFSVLLRLLVAANLLSLCSFVVQAQGVQGGVCFLFYGSPGTIDYPWSVSVSLNLSYFRVPQMNPSGTFYLVLNGTALYTYTNKFGGAVLSSYQQVSRNQYVYINSPMPVNRTGVGFPLAPIPSTSFQTFQLPSVGPRQSFSSISLSNTSAGGLSLYVQLGAAFSLDTNSEAWVASSVPGFVNRTIPPSSINALSVDYTSCQARIDINNHRVSRIAPSPGNTASQFNYSYTIGDGATYTVTTSLTINAFSVQVDQLGNQYQNITAVRGRRVYKYSPSGATITSNVTGLSFSSGTPSQFWYPFAYRLSPVPTECVHDRQCPFPRWRRHRLLH